MEQVSHIGVIGSGFTAKGFVMALEERKDLVVSRVLTHTNVQERTDFPRQDLLTNSIDDLIRNSDLVLECSGDVIHGTEAVDKVLSASLPVITMDSELQVTTGSYFVRRGLITEAEGDQPGCLAALRANILEMGFRPLVYGNIKGFLNHHPTIAEMEFWAKEQNLSLDKVISFTDGTKIQFEQALVANGLGAGIARSGLLGITSEDVDSGAKALAQEAKTLGYPLSDYILSPKSPPGVFIAAEHDERQSMYLSNYKLGKGPYYVLLKPFHLCHLEITKTIRRVLKGDGVLINNSVNPTISVSGIAKRHLDPGYIIRRGIGSFDVRGTAVRIADNRGHVPIGLLADAVVIRHIEPGHQIDFDDVEIPESLALHAWREIEQSI